jgi:hypothetical protein
VNDEQRTTASIYVADLEWLKQRQLAVSAAAQAWTPMADIVRQLIHQADLRNQDGIVMVPLIENIEAFSQRTAELRAQGFTREADARDRFARREGRP